MSTAPVALGVMEPPDAFQIVKQLLKIAEILSRAPYGQSDEVLGHENGIENQDGPKIGYLEADDPS